MDGKSKSGRIVLNPGGVRLNERQKAEQSGNHSSSSRHADKILTPAKREKMLIAIRKGWTPEIVANWVGLSVAEVRRWMEKLKKEEGDHGDYTNQVRD